jgi:organic radical activating enzyme
MDWSQVRLELALNDNCNRKCPHCYAAAKPRPQTLMAPDEIKAILDDYSKAGGLRVSFSGGEPTLTNDLLLNAISHAKKNGLVVGITTNSWWARPGMIDKHLTAFAKAGLNAMVLSFDTFHARGGVKWPDVKRVLVQSPKYNIKSVVAWGTRHSDNGSVYDDMKWLVDDDVDFLYQHSIFGHIMAIGRAKTIPMLSQLPYACRQDDWPIVIMIAGKMFSWRCEARNPVFMYRYKGDWTAEAERIENDEDTQRRIHNGLLPVILLAHREYLDGCDLCHDLASHAYPRIRKVLPRMAIKEAT